MHLVHINLIGPQIYTLELHSTVDNCLEPCPAITFIVILFPKVAFFR